MPCVFRVFKLGFQIGIMLRGIVRNCEELCGIARNCNSLQGIAMNCEELCGIVRNCAELWGIVRNCEELCGIAMNCVELRGIVGVQRNCAWIVRNWAKLCRIAKNCVGLCGILRNCEELSEFQGIMRNSKELLGLAIACKKNSPKLETLLQALKWTVKVNYNSLFKDLHIMWFKMVSFSRFLFKYDISTLVLQQQLAVLCSRTKREI